MGACREDGALSARCIDFSDGAIARAASGTVSAMAWLVQHVPVSTATLAAIFGSGLQELVWRDLVDRGPATVHELTDRTGEDHQRVRNALYRLAMLRAVRCMARVPSPLSPSTPRVMWVALDRDGLPQYPSANSRESWSAGILNAK